MTESKCAPASWWTVRDTPIGSLLLAATRQGLVNVVFHADRLVVPAAVRRLAGRFDGAAIRVGDGGAPLESAPHLAEAARQIDAYFAGRLKRFDLPLDWSFSGGFNHRVLLELAAGVPYGEVVGYQTLADRVGEPGAARAVGVAMGSNPLPVVVACHRVVESGGGIGGFGGGLETKRTLLALEGVLPEPLF
ncbi:methylated-DNA--[protein]-cysteine S-methyltransferase [Streptomyces sp. ICBB 8177]|uniref:methylated-DNA--[protein]-cysteine S-methyltransferase n=1 Tax=Streptomyces sp. ICBB 8177 TaxID=563922 RepID=UPI000D67B2F9|nr:methylated-DNA--[protein]-cysteine S-methyltransferase [Streptomyces sp. ICBB 8177]PWI43489.1 cysteine methyltransferase [Streptomyces sp. ICBB 8177]